MKRSILFIALALVYATVAWGVNLPKNTYTAKSQESEKTAQLQSVMGTGSIIKGTYLGTTETSCDYPGEPTLCANCCQPKVLVPCFSECQDNEVCRNECFTQYLACVNDCETGSSLPLTGGEPFILVLAGLFYGIRGILNKKTNTIHK